MQHTGILAEERAVEEIAEATAEAVEVAVAAADSGGIRPPLGIDGYRKRLIIVHYFVKIVQNFCRLDSKL